MREQLVASFNLKPSYRILKTETSETMFKAITNDLSPCLGVEICNGWPIGESKEQATKTKIFFSLTAY